MAETYHNNCINFRLPGILALSEHRSSHKLVPILPANEFSRLEEDRRSIRPGHRLPFRPRSESTVDRGRDGCLVSFVVRAEVLRVIPGQSLFSELARLDLYRRSSEIELHTDQLHQYSPPSH